MKSWTSLPQTKKEQLGIVHTPGEIAQQPAMWRAVSTRIKEQQGELAAWLKAAPQPFVLTGAGTSEYVARCVAPSLRRAGFQAHPIPTTEIVVDPVGQLPNKTCTLVSFARSGNSPESVAALDLVDKLLPESRHLAITCNAEGALAKRLGSSAKDYSLLMPPETNDRGLAMTSSYSSMTVAGMSLASITSDGDLDWIQALADAGERLLEQGEESAKRTAELGFDRAVFIGGGPHFGTALEAHLKLQELTDGGVICKAEGTLGVRHGPMAAIHPNTLIVLFLSASTYARQYEIDLLREMRAKELGCATVVIGSGLNEVPDLGELADTLVDVGLPDDQPVDDVFRAPLYILWPQMLAVHASLHRGLKPDTPSAAGVINRVVEGVRIHPWEG